MKESSDWLYYVLQIVIRMTILLYFVTIYTSIPAIVPVPPVPVPVPAPLQTYKGKQMEMLDYIVPGMILYIYSPVGDKLTPAGAMYIY